MIASSSAGLPFLWYTGGSGASTLVGPFQPLPLSSSSSIAVHLELVKHGSPHDAHHRPHSAHGGELGLNYPGSRLGPPGVDLAVDNSVYRGGQRNQGVAGWFGAPLLAVIELHVCVKVCSSGFTLSSYSWLFPARHLRGWSITVAFPLTCPM